MKKILSIDWDFFINATFEERCLLFPDGNENLGDAMNNYLWKRHYEFFDELSKIGVTDDLSTFIEYMLTNYATFMWVADSHKYAYNFIMDFTDWDEEFEVYNLDYHHDLYHYRTGNERVNCGNWGTILQEDRPNMKYIWVKRDDSDTETIGGVEVPCEKIDFVEFLKRIDDDRSFDYVFLCRSSMWSPPHLDHKFLELCVALNTPITFHRFVEEKVLECREVR